MKISTISFTVSARYGKRYVIVFSGSISLKQKNKLLDEVWANFIIYWLNIRGKFEKWPNSELIFKQKWNHHQNGHFHYNENNIDAFHYYNSFTRILILILGCVAIGYSKCEKESPPKLLIHRYPVQQILVLRRKIKIILKKVW